MFLKHSRSFQKIAEKITNFHCNFLSSNKALFDLKKIGFRVDFWKIAVISYVNLCDRCNRLSFPSQHDGFFFEHTVLFTSIYNYYIPVVKIN